jgi:hypothetical protein
MTGLEYDVLNAQILSLEAIKYVVRPSRKTSFVAPYKPWTQDTQSSETI